MTSFQFSEIMTPLYQAAGRPVDPRQLEVWYERAANIPERILRSAVARIIDNDDVTRHFPSWPRIAECVSIVWRNEDRREYADSQTKKLRSGRPWKLLGQLLDMRGAPDFKARATSLCEEACTGATKEEADALTAVLTGAMGWDRPAERGKTSP